MINNTFIGNRARSDGGAVDLEDLEGGDANNSFSNNIVGGRRSVAVQIWRYPSNLENITIIENVAIRNGGGVALLRAV